jgi:hypothetical protein
MLFISCFAAENSRWHGTARCFAGQSPKWNPESCELLGHRLNPFPFCELHGKFKR